MQDNGYEIEERGKYEMRFKRFLWVIVWATASSIGITAAADDAAERA